MKVIKNRRSYVAAYRKFDKLVALKVLSSTQREERDLLMVLLGDYERRTEKQVMLREWMLNNKEVSRATGISTRRLAKVMKNQLMLTLHEANQIAAYLDISPRRLTPWM